jgi:hypothetical protein
MECISETRQKHQEADNEPHELPSSELSRARSEKIISCCEQNPASADYYQQNPDNGCLHISPSIYLYFSFSGTKL